MKTTVNFYQFARDFNDMRPENFSYEGLMVLFDYLEDLEEGIGEEIEFDVIALCCDYVERHYTEIAEDYGIENDPETVQFFLEDHTCLCGVTSNLNFVYLDF